MAMTAKTIARTRQEYCWNKVSDSLYYIPTFHEPKDGLLEESQMNWLSPGCIGIRNGYAGFDEVDQWCSEDYLS